VEGRKTVKKRLDELVLERGLAKNVKEAQALIMAGQVVAGTTPLTKAGSLVDTNTSLSLKEKNPYVSRGGLKLEAALCHFHIPVKDKVCMDVGASTGGFTDCLLQHGARKIYAVDVGKNLLDFKLRNDPRVVNLEGINFRYFSPDLLKEQVEFVTMDVSFISLERILPVVVRCMLPDAELLAMVKPQFEAQPHETEKGVVTDESVRKRTFDEIKHCAATLGLELKGEMDSPVKGPRGNIEHFLWLKKNS